jgi:hypothetical protein
MANNLSLTPSRQVTSSSMAKEKAKRENSKEKAKRENSKEKEMRVFFFIIS